MLQQPVPFQDAAASGSSGRRRIRDAERISEGGGSVDLIIMSKEEREMGEVGEGQSVDGRLLGVEMLSNGRVKVRVSEESHQTYRRRPELFRVFLHVAGESVSRELNRGSKGIRSETLRGLLTGLD